MPGQADVRQAVVAGTFYPGSADRLRAQVDGLLAEAPVSSCEGGRVRGVVAPHAGYVYSGPVAASAYACLSSVAVPPTRIVIAGLSHFVPLRGLAVTGARAWWTPLGEVPVDVAARAALLAAGAHLDEAPHRGEHSIEVHLPFIQRTFPGVPVLPVAVGEGAPASAAEVLSAALSDDTLLVVSTDLSHYLDAGAARRQDARTAAAVEALDLEALRSADACGIHPLRAAMAWASRSDCRIRLLDLRSSADTAGDPARVVGYGAFTIESTHAGGK